MGRDFTNYIGGYNISIEDRGAVQEYARVLAFFHPHYITGVVAGLHCTAATLWKIDKTEVTSAKLGGDGGGFPGFVFCPGREILVSCLYLPAAPDLIQLSPQFAHRPEYQGPCSDSPHCLQYDQGQRSRSQCQPADGAGMAAVS